MAKLKKHEDVDERFLAGAQKQNIMRYQFPFPARVLWAALVDADTWTRWLDIKSLTWTSPRPLGVGATRTLDIGNGGRIDEYFFAWEEGVRMAFRFDASTLPISAFAEDYVLEDRDGGCELIWTFRGKAFPLLLPLLNGRLRAGAKKGFPKLESWICDHPESYGL